MTVYRCLPVFAEHSAELLSVVVQRGTVEGDCVRVTEGHLSALAGWHSTPAEAWESCAHRIDAVVDELRHQADGCRMRATEEVLS